MKDEKKGAYSGSHSNSNSKQDKGKKKNETEENSGAAIFLYTDEATGLSQTFAFNLRYYKGANDTSIKGSERHDGLYEFAV